ncbi:MAG TPA: CPBP family glutamic-type intramembrane protease [Candidatus Dormibacteraeota bacterium]
MIAPADRSPARQPLPPWRAAAITLVVPVLGLGAALLVPNAFSDPNGVDPYTARLGAAAILMAVPALLVARLRPARGILLALVAVAATYVILSAGPQILVDVFGPGLFTSPLGNGEAQVFWASLAQALLTLAVAVLALRVVPAAWRPALRFGARPWALLQGLALSAVLLGAGLALPASLLGRVALQPVATLRDLPWLGPANALQAFAQEVQFRGLLMGALERYLPRGWANVAQAAVFALAHLAISYGGPEAPFVPITFVVGLVFGWLVQRTGSIWPAVIIHAVADVALQFAVVPGLYGF